MEGSQEGRDEDAGHVLAMLLLSVVGGAFPMSKAPALNVSE
jgi:hypothetical protein